MYWTLITTDNSIYTYEYFLQGDVCRLCWNKNIIEENEESFEKPAEVSFAEIIKECLDIEVESISPNRLCKNCCNEVKRFYSFKNFCRESNRKLQEILCKGSSEVKRGDLELSAVKDEVVDVNFDKIDEFPDNDVEFQDASLNKIAKPNSKLRKKYLYKHSPTYCNICCLDLHSKEELSSHNIEFHGIENEGTLFKCFGCEKRFKSKKTRISHEVNFCKGLKDGYKCNICNRYLPKRCMYEFHMRDHRHNTLTELPEHIFKCCKCLKLFKTNELLKIHMLEHGKEKNFVCDTCGRIFTRQDYLHKHKLTHTGTKRHQCPHCDFRATQRSSLTVHIRTHTGERPYSCDVCPQRCISSSNLRAHKRRHLGVKKYECSICNKKFGYKISLEEHISSAHVRSETHPCEHCGATYTRLRGLRRHLAAKHGKQSKRKTVEQNILVQVTDEDANQRTCNQIDTYCFILAAS
ncbi:unnamed protein product [Arctia plantaginis]|uniref:Uncharacterized protein n=1 Tax=Arctia plantaginis TaxID=874455 RepID=A0A8S0YTA9_ARCPL|nr:unnamed protein product [Arctia plantaginis]